MFFLLFLLQGCNVLSIFTLCTLLLFLFEHRFVVVVLFSRLLLHFICLLEQCCIFSIIAFFCHILLFLFILLDQRFIAFLIQVIRLFCGLLFRFFDQRLVVTGICCNLIIPICRGD